MNILQRVFKRKGLCRKRKDVFGHPTPSGVHALAEHVAAQGDVSEAIDILQEGLRVFPGSERLLTFTHSLQRQQRRKEIEGLLLEEKRRPAPGVFGRLAEVYRSLADDDAALEVCRRCIALFPDDENPYLVQGKIRLARFYRGLSQRDGELAAENLERVVGLNPHNVKARVLLAEFYSTIGLDRCALRHLESISEAAQADSRLQHLCEVVSSKIEPGSDNRTLSECLREVSLSRRVEKSSDWVPSVQYLPDRPDIRSRNNEEELFDEMKKAGASRSVFIPDCHLLPPGTDTFARMVSEITQSCRGPLREMDLGEVLGAVFTGEFGHIVVAALGHSAAAAQCGQTGPADDIAERLQDFLSRNGAVERRNEGRSEWMKS